MKLPEVIKGVLARNVRLFSFDERLNAEIPAEVDLTDRGLVMVDAIHHLTHKGIVYDLSAYAAAVADGASLDLTLAVDNNKTVHLLPHGAAESKAMSYLYEAPTVTVAGTPVTAANRNRRDFAPAHTTSIELAPTVSDPGTLLHQQAMFAATGAGNKLGAPSTGGTSEWVLKEGETYLFRMTNLAGQAADAWLNLVFYEADQ